MRCHAVVAFALLLPAFLPGQVAVFGDGSDGALSASGATSIAQATNRLSAAVSAGSTVLPLMSTADLSAGNEVLLVTIQGTGAGQHEFAHISSVGASDITLTAGIANSYASGTDTRVVRVYHYSSVSVASGGTLYSAGPVLAFRSAGAVTLDGSLSAGGNLYASGLGGGGPLPGGSGQQGASINGNGTASTAANDGGGGGGTGGTATGAGGGGGGGYGTAGAAGSTNNFVTGGSGGGVYGATFPTAWFTGSGGGGGGAVLSGMTSGGKGGGLIVVYAPSVTVSGTGSIDADGEAGEDGTDSFVSGKSGGGGGSGGSIFLHTSVAGGLSNGGTIHSLGGAGGGLVGSAGASVGFGGAGGSGRVHVDGSISGAGSISPSATTGPGEPVPAAAEDWDMYY